MPTVCGNRAVCFVQISAIANTRVMKFTTHIHEDIIHIKIILN